MRARSQTELNSADRMQRIANNPYLQPRQLRETLRQLLADTGVTAIQDALADPDPNVRLRALELAYKYGIGTQTGLVDADNESISGVVALPALQLEAVQTDISPIRLLPAGPEPELDADLSGPIGEQVATSTETGQIGPVPDPGK